MNKKVENLCLICNEGLSQIKQNLISVFILGKMANRGMVYLTPDPDVPQIIFEETTPCSTLITEFEISEVENHQVSNPSVGSNSFKNRQNLRYPLHLPGSIEEVPRSISPGDPFIQPLSDSSPVEDSNGQKIVAALQSQRTLKRTGKSKGIFKLFLHVPKAQYFFSI